MSELPIGSLEDLLAKSKEATGSTKFSREAARLAGVKSGAARRPLEKDKDARRVYSYVCQTADMLAARMLTGTGMCPHCKRGGPIDPRTMQTLASTLKDYCDTILFYAWGRPSQESKDRREGSIESFKQAQREVNSEDNKEYAPPELTSILDDMVPSESTDETESSS